MGGEINLGTALPGLTRSYNSSKHTKRNVSEKNLHKTVAKETYIVVCGADFEGKVLTFLVPLALSPLLRLSLDVTHRQSPWLLPRQQT